MRHLRTTLRLLTTALLSMALLNGLAGPGLADHDGTDHDPCEPTDPCEPHPCEPGVEVTGARGDDVPNPWGLDPLYAGWTTIDVILSDHERCGECFIESASLSWDTEIDNPMYGVSAGVDFTQVDSDTWLVHNLDADVYAITFTAWVICDGETFQVTADYYQFN